MTTPIFPKNQRQCARFSINVAILFLSFKRATTMPNKLIDSQNYKRLRRTTLIPFTLTFHPHNHAVKCIILENFKLFQNYSETGFIFSQPPLLLLILFKRDKNIGNFLVGSSFQTNDQPETFKCARSWCKTCPYIHKEEKMSGPKRSIKITNHFTCTSANVIYHMTCTYCKKLYIGETGIRIGDRFREQLRDVERNDKDASKPVAWYFNLLNHSKQHMTACGLSLHPGS